MIYISYGIPKSASSFCFLLTKDLLTVYARNNRYFMKRIGDFLAQHQYGDFFLPTEELSLDSLIKKILGSSFKNICIAIKVHCGISDYIKSLIEKGVILASASFRHPADCILSYMDAYQREYKNSESNRFKGGESFESCINIFEKAENTFIKWAETENVLLLNFNEVALRPELVVQKMCNQLNFHISADELLIPYKTGQKKILEFNKGVIDRRFAELSPSQILEIEQRCKILVNFIEKYKRTLTKQYLP